MDTVSIMREKIDETEQDFKNQQSHYSDKIQSLQKVIESQKKNEKSHRNTIQSCQQEIEMKNQQLQHSVQMQQKLKE